MIYEIQDKSDILSGASLIVKMPEEELDRKALYTIQKDRPGFLLPFYYRIVDGQIEFVYQIGARCQMHYLAGDRYPKDYAKLWSGLLTPLLDCGDWFLRPYSFVLDVRRLYCDKNNKTVSYVYIPSIRDHSDYFSLKDMAAEFSRQMTVTDADLENKVLRAIMTDFNPKEFLQILKPYNDESAQIACISTVLPTQYSHEPKVLPASEQIALKQDEIPIPESSVAVKIDCAPDVFEDILIDFPADRKTAKKNKKSIKENDDVHGRKEKRQTNRKHNLSAIVNKSELQQEAVDGVDDASPGIATIEATPRREPSQHTTVEYNTLPAEFDGITQCIQHDVSGTWLRYVGSASLPAGIDVAIAEGEIFTVGRYDVAIGKQQSSFEFDKTTKAVSRRHAAIERRPDGYSIVDLLSSAGTFINGNKLPPNTPFTLQPGCRVSFGNCGADYIWEQ